MMIELCFIMSYLLLQIFKKRLQIIQYISPLLLIGLNITQCFGNLTIYSYITFIFPFVIYDQDQLSYNTQLFYLFLRITHLILLTLFYCLNNLQEGQPIVLFIIVSFTVVFNFRSHQTPLNHLNHEQRKKSINNNEIKTDTFEPLEKNIAIIELNEDFSLLSCNYNGTKFLQQYSLETFLQTQVGFIDKQTKMKFQEELSCKISSIQDLKETYNSLSLKDLLDKIKLNLELPHTVEIFKLQGFEQFYFKILIENKNTYEREQFTISLQDLSEYTHYIKRTHTQTTMKQLFKSFSHEFNTSLNYILALAQVASSTDFVQKQLQDKYFNPILHSGRIMNSLVNDLMDYNLILSKQFNLEVSNFNVSQLIQEVIDLFKYQVKQKHLTIQYENNLLQQDIVSDRNRIRQILINLISNAQKFTFQGDITISVGTIINNKQICIIFHVKDTGIGMNEDEQERLQKLLLSGVPDQLTISQNTAGFGLGLFISNKIAEVLSQSRYEKGGGLRFESNNPNGFHAWFIAKNQAVSKFLNKPLSNPTPIIRINKKVQMDTMTTKVSRRINVLPMRQKFSQLLGIKENKSDRKLHKELTLKLRKPPVKLAKELFEAAIHSEKKIENDSINQETNDKEYDQRIRYLFDEKSKQNTQTCKCPKILIADDEQINIMALSIMLEQMGYNSDSVFNGQECVNLILSQKKTNNCERCIKTPYKMIFMDINMPILDGIEATKIIKEQNKQMIIIACTAYADTETRDQCYRSGMSYYLSKPVKKDQLIEILSYYQI